MRNMLLISCLLFMMQARSQNDSLPYMVVLGVAQDGGYPHIGCEKSCCSMAWKHDSMKRFVVSLALADPVARKWWLFEASPDITAQLHLFGELTGHRFGHFPDGVFITHAHIGHYTGLMQLGREASGAKEVPVYAMPRLSVYLQNNGPWSQLVQLRNIVLQPVTPDSVIRISDRITITSFTVPHRDEYSETAGFKIHTTGKRYLFIPDIDKWERFSHDIVTEVKNTDIAFLDATFFSGNELPGRSIKEVPHPFVQETIALFMKEPVEIRKRVRFIHFNHTNPLLWDNNVQLEIQHKGYSIARQGEKL